VNSSIQLEEEEERQLNNRINNICDSILDQRQPTLNQDAYTSDDEMEDTNNMIDEIKSEFDHLFVTANSFFDTDPSELLESTPEEKKNFTCFSSPVPTSVLHTQKLELWIRRGRLFCRFFS